MSSSEYHPVRIGELLPSLLKRLGKPPVPVLQAVFGKWHEIVGETLGDEIAQNCTPVAIESDKLIVSASNSAWADELRWNQAQVLEKLSEITKGHHLKGLIMRVEPHRGSGAKTPPPR